VYNAAAAKGFHASVREAYDRLWRGRVLAPPVSNVIQLLRNNFTNLSKIRVQFASGPGFTIDLTNVLPFSLFPDVAALAATQEQLAT